MKILFIVRHGYYSGEDLNDFGKRQMLEIGEKIRKMLDSDSISIVSSTAPRAYQSAEILSNFLAVPFEGHEVLWSDNMHRQDNQAAFEIIMSKQESDAVVVVTHLEYSEDLPAYFAEKNAWGVPIGYAHTDKGGAWVLDCVNKTKTQI